MNSERSRSSALILLAASLTAVYGQTAPVDALGKQVYDRKCAVCHDHPQERIPPRDSLAASKREAIVEALTTGVMQTQGKSLSPAEIGAVAGYLTASPASVTQPKLPEADLRANLCSQSAPPLTLEGAWSGFSPGSSNTRYQPSPGMRVEDIPRLKPKWVFAYPGGSSNGPPSIVGGRVFIGTVVGSVMSLDAKTGCTYWATPKADQVRTPIAIARVSAGSSSWAVAFYADRKAVVHAVSADTGEPIWRTKVDDHAFATISGALNIHDNRVYVPVTSGEGAMGPRADYSCCTFRGSMVALDAGTGKLLWKTYTIEETPRPFKLNRAGTQMYGPAGVGIWTPPTVDPVRKAVYSATAESKTAMSVDTADAIMAFDWETGKRLWHTQATAGDNWIQGCEGASIGANCPDPLGPDADFSAPPMLLSLPNGRRALVAGQKSGWITAVDPDTTGKILWRTNLAKDVPVPRGQILRDRAQAGVVFGMASDGERIYAAVADPEKKPGHIPLGIFALSPINGAIVWQSRGEPVPSCAWGPKGCAGAQRTAVTAMPGVVFAGSSNGHMRAYSAATGKVLWDFDTAHSWPAVNGVSAQGGSIEGIATAIAEGRLLVMSGFATFGGGRGNALVAFTIDGK
jgi:polyvinyl alcohol dehydrogenase (cytochrome)